MKDLRLFFKLVIIQKKNIFDLIFKVPIFEMFINKYIVDLLDIDLARLYLIFIIKSKRDYELQLRRKNNAN